MAELFLKRVLVGAACFVATTHVAFAADTIGVSYIASASGAPVFKASLIATLDGASYSASFDGKTTGVTNMLSKYKIGLNVTGNASGSKLVPAKFNKATSKKKKDKYANVEFGAGSLTSLVTQDGPQTETPAVLSAIKGKAVDPLTAILRVAVSQGAAGAKPCSGTQRFYDGRDVGDLSFSLVKKMPVANGTAYHCKMTYSSVAGRNVENHDDAMVVYGLWLVPVAIPSSKATIYLPARLTGQYAGLSVSVEATGISVNGADATVVMPE